MRIGRVIVRSAPGTTEVVTDTAPEQELAEQEQKKEEEVLEREGVEQELMQEGQSEVGERIDDVEVDE